eukprot:tig00000444_g801.t1
MAHEPVSLYQKSTIGVCLTDAVDELVQTDTISPTLAMIILKQFDKSINEALATKAKAKCTIKDAKLHLYRFCDNVWTFIIDKPKIKPEGGEELQVPDKVKIVAIRGAGEAEKSKGSGKGGKGASSADH